MAQQGMTIVSLVGPDDDMGDLEFIEGKVLANNYFQVSGDIDALNDTIEFIPAVGKRAFMIEAKITMKTNPTITVTQPFSSEIVNDQVVSELKIDNITKSKAKIGVTSSYFIDSGEGAGLGTSTNSESRFNVLGLSLIGDGVKKIEIENILDSGNAFAEMSGYLIDTV